MLSTGVLYPPSNGQLVLPSPRGAIFLGRHPGSLTVGPLLPVLASSPDKPLALCIPAHTALLRPRMCSAVPCFWAYAHVSLQPAFLFPPLSKCLYFSHPSLAVTLLVWISPTCFLIPEGAYPNPSLGGLAFCPLHTQLPTAERVAQGSFSGSVSVASSR